MSGKIYVDSRGWMYQVMPGIAGGEKPKHKIRYRKPDKVSWHGLPTVQWHDDPEEAEAELEAQAAKKGWKER